MPRLNLRRDGWLIAALLAALPAVPAPAPADAPLPDIATQTRQFSEAVASSMRLDPRSPGTLNGRLDFASFLAQTNDGDCDARLNDAQQQFDQVAAMPATEITLPFGPAQLAKVEYQIHHRRATCSKDPQLREDELHLALEAARRAVGLYREALDYRAMAVMQFNAAALLLELGQAGGATAELQTAIALDREFGFEADARDNYARLIAWTHDPAGAARAAQLMSDFPRRRVTLVFGWSAVDVSTTIDVEHAAVIGGGVVRSRHSVSAARQMREHGSAWTLSAVSDKGTPAVDPTASAAALQWQLITLFGRAHPQSPTIEVSRSGEYRYALDLEKFAAGLESDTLAQAAGLLKDTAAGVASTRLDAEIKTALEPEVVAAKAAEQYNLETGAWIGATLEQGVWYEMPALLSMPGTPDGVIHHVLKFAYTRPIPCTDDSVSASCAEIVVWATPEPEALNAALLNATRKMKLPPGRKVTYASSTYLRLVTDPATLLARESDIRRYSYMTIGDTSPEHVLAEYERARSRSSYRPAAQAH